MCKIINATANNKNKDIVREVEIPEEMRCSRISCVECSHNPKTKRCDQQDTWIVMMQFFPGIGRFSCAKKDCR